MAKVETGVVGDPSVSVDMGDGTETADAISNSGAGVISDPTDEELEGDLDGGEGDEGSEVDEGSTGEDAGEPGDDGEPLEDLGEFSDETLEAYDTRYRGDNGELRLDILTREWDQNAAGNEQGAGNLNEGTYQYLQETYGLSKAQVQDIERGQVAQRKLYFSEVAQAAGGNENLAAMVAWGKKAYSPAARKRFNEAYRSGDVERATEAVEALASRFNKANGKGPRRPVNPVRSATKNAGGPGGPSVQGFASRDDWMAARKDARGDRKKEAEVQRKFRASNRRKWDS